mgnify:CR=1 FL=1
MYLSKLLAIYLENRYSLSDILKLSSSQKISVLTHNKLYSIS